MKKKIRLKCIDKDEDYHTLYRDDEGYTYTDYGNNIVEKDLGGSIYKWEPINDSDDIYIWKE